MKTYIYVKTHRVTGLKYLGKTQRDPYKYQGSGIYWTNHIKKHGYDVDTEVLCECETAEEVKERGLYYSELWNVVESSEWANLTEETGTGFSSRQSKKLWQDAEYRKARSEQSKKQWEDPEYREKMIEKMESLEYREKMRELTKKQWENPEHREKRSEQTKKLWEDPEHKEKMSEHSKKLWEDPVYREKMNERNKKLWENPEHREKMSEHSKKLWEDPVYREKMIIMRGGKNHPNYNPAVYLFVHETGIEEYCTRYELRTRYSLDHSKISALIKGTRKSHKGWRIVKE